MRLPPRPIRRLLLPVQVGALVLLATGFGATAALAAMVARWTPRRRILRVAGFGVAYCTTELAALVAAGGLWLRQPRLGAWRAGSEAAWVASNQAVLASAVSSILRAARRCLGFDVVLAASPEPATLVGAEPVLVLARHGGPGDSLALVHLLLSRYHRRVRIVLKEILQLDPALDLLLNRLGCCFLPSSSTPGADLGASLAAAARQLSAGDALLIFPEGRNWTPERRRRAIRRLRADHGPEAARTAALMVNVLPPRPGGVLACLEARPDLGVVVVAHAGLDRVVRVRQAWRLLPFTTPMTVRMWPAAPVPRDKDARLAWLTTEWAIVDEWVDAYHAKSADPLADEHGRGDEHLPSPPASDPTPVPGVIRSEDGSGWSLPGRGGRSRPGC